MLINPLHDSYFRSTTLYPRLLVVTGSAPGFDGVDAVLQRQILEDIPRDLLHIALILPHNSKRKICPEWVDSRFERRFEHSYRPVGGPVGQLTAFLGHNVLGRRRIRQLTDACVAAGRRHKAEAVFAVLDCPTTIFIANRVAHLLSVPLYSFVMDGPALHINDFGYGRTIRRQLLTAFDAVMQKSRRIATAGEAMQKAYQARYGKPTYILRQGLEYSPIESCSEPPVESDCVRIGFAGSLTARDAFDELIAELDRRHWKLAGRKVILRIVGARLLLSPVAAQHIEYFGWRMVPDMLQLMQECHFLYMPQPFSGHLREFAELSFPNKLCTYVPARRPIMLHTPPNASLPAFFDRFPCGLRTTELNAHALLDQVENSIRNPDLYHGYVQAVENAFRDELNVERLRLEVRRFLGNHFHAVEKARP